MKTIYVAHFAPPFDRYQWVTFYEALADKLLDYKDRRDELFELIKTIAADQPFMGYLNFDRDDWWSGLNYHIDPFSVFAVFNRVIKNENRTELAEVYAKVFGIDVSVPIAFDGIPLVNNQRSFFSGADDCWDLFVRAIEVAQTNNPTAEFVAAFETALKAKGNGLANITIGLYWVRPNYFIPLDGNSRSYIYKTYELSPPSDHSGADYVKYLATLKEKIASVSPSPDSRAQSASTAHRIFYSYCLY